MTLKSHGEELTQTSALDSMTATIEFDLLVALNNDCFELGFVLNTGLLNNALGLRKC